MRKLSLATCHLLLVVLLLTCCSAPERQVTYCNPIDIDYSYMVYNSEHDLSYRSGADPAVVEFRGEYYMFVTRSHGYWHSKDLTRWEFITPRSIWYPQGSNAPAAHNYRDSILYVCGDPSGSMSLLYSDDPASGVWKAVPAILHDLQDPDFFIDDDGSAWMFWGSSNVYPLRGKRLDPAHRFLVSGETFPVIRTDAARHGWERFGENHSDTVIAAYIEGPWLTKHNGRYYMQYAAPGTEFNVYGDGVYVADSITGPYTYQRHNPVSYKPGGFMNGAGHGSTVLGPGGQYWHYGTMSLSATVNWERRICAYPLFFDEEGIMYCNCEYGDWPHYAPSSSDRHGAFTGWVLLSYGKPVTSSGYQPGGAREAAGFAAWNKPKISPDFRPENVVDENCKTYWLANSNSDQEWLCIDLLAPCRVHALQINYHDHYSQYYSRVEGLQHRFVIEGSLDGEHWQTLEDRSRHAADNPNAYIELRKPARVRYVRYRNIEVPTTHLAISGLRVFGLGEGVKPAPVEGFHAERGHDRREATLSWQPVAGAVGYQVRWGIAPDKLYLSWLVYGDTTSLTLRCLDTDTEYYYDIEAFNENGIGPKSTPDVLRVMSFNIRLGVADDGENSWDYRKHAGICMLRQYRPHVWGVQEAYEWQLSYLTDSLPYRALGVGRDDGRHDGEHMSILFDTTAIEMVRWGTYWLSETPTIPSLGWDAACRRTATWALLREKEGGRAFYMVNTHLDHVGRVARSRGLRLVMDSIAAMNPEGYPLVLTGDMNVRPTDPCLVETAQRMHNARYTASETDNRPSFNGWGTAAEEIDYIWYSGFDGADRFRVLTERFDQVPYISDHYPIYSELRWYK